MAMKSASNTNIQLSHECLTCSGGFRGGSGGSLEPPLEAYYFNFMGK